MPDAPIHCRPAAYELMQAQLPVLETGAGLLGGAIAIALHADPDLAPERVEIELDRIVEVIRGRLRGADPRAIVAHAHAVLFDELGFRGDVDDYYDPRNSFLHDVLTRRRGLPITLALVYKLVLEPFGVDVQGVNAPGHFLVRVAVDGDPPMLIDAFAGGRVLSTAEAIARAREVVGDAFRQRAVALPLASHREWLLRMLRNLIGVFHARDAAADRAAMEELSRLVAADG